MVSLLLSEPFIRARSKKFLAELSFAIENRIVTAWNKELRPTRTDRTQKGEKGLVAVVEL